MYLPRNCSNNSQLSVTKHTYLKTQQARKSCSFRLIRLEFVSPINSTKIIIDRTSIEGFITPTLLLFSFLSSCRGTAVLGDLFTGNYVPPDAIQRPSVASCCLALSQSRVSRIHPGGRRKFVAPATESTGLLFRLVASWPTIRKDRGRLKNSEGPKNRVQNGGGRSSTLPARPIQTRLIANPRISRRQQSAKLVLIVGN